MRAIALSVVALTVAGSAVLGACSGQPEFEFKPETCYYVAQPEGKAPELQTLGENVAQIELCAARLEEMRLRFLRMGGSNQEVTGAYQGRFIFIDREGVKFGKSLTGSRFFAMARTGDGRLAIPGAIQRDETGRPIAVAAEPEAK